MNGFLKIMSCVLATAANYFPPMAAKTSAKLSCRLVAGNFLKNIHEQILNVCE